MVNEFKFILLSREGNLAKTVKVFYKILMKKSCRAYRGLNSKLSLIKSCF